MRKAVAGVAMAAAAFLTAATPPVFAEAQGSPAGSQSTTAQPRPDENSDGSKGMNGMWGLLGLAGLLGLIPRKGGHGTKDRYESAARGASGEARDQGDRYG